MLSNKNCCPNPVLSQKNVQTFVCPKKKLFVQKNVVQPFLSKTFVVQKRCLSNNLLSNKCFVQEQISPDFFCPKQCLSEIKNCPKRLSVQKQGCPINVLSGKIVCPTNCLSVFLLSKKLFVQYVFVKKKKRSERATLVNELFGRCDSETRRRPTSRCDS